MNVVWWVQNHSDKAVGCGFSLGLQKEVRSGQGPDPVCGKGECAPVGEGADGAAGHADDGLLRRGVLGPLLQVEHRRGPAPGGELSTSTLHPLGMGKRVAYGEEGGRWVGPVVQTSPTR